MNKVKEEVIEDNISSPEEIQGVVQDAADSYNITLTEDQMNKIVSLMESISQYDYDVKALKNTLDNLSGKDNGFFSNLWSSIKGIFTGGDSDGGIISQTKDDLLGDNAIIDSTLDAVQSAADGDDDGGFWSKIVNFFKDLFGGNDDADDSEDASEDDAAATEDIDDSDTVDSDAGQDIDGSDDTDTTDTDTDGSDDSSQEDSGLVIDNDSAASDDTAN